MPALDLLAAGKPRAAMTPPEDDKEITQDIHSPAPAALRERYELLGELGRGGMGVVYKARDKETGGVVALKVLQAEIAARPDVIERFKSELLLARKITHKNVCRTHELLRFGDTVVISMEYVEGESLRAVLKRFGGVPLRRGLEWTAQICSALAEAHAQGVVHRDLKPENILIARDGSAKVMDFGIARSLEPQATATAMATIIGTPAYMSPEQAEGKPVDHRTDVYALGLVLYEMFTGRQAFHSDTPMGMLTARLQEIPPPPSSVEPDLPDRIDRAIQKCLERKPEKRFQSVSEVEAALSKRPQPRAALGEAGDVPLPLHLTRWQRSDWLLLPLAAAGLLLFFSFFDACSLAPRTPVAFDRGALPRIAQEFAQRAGATVGRDYRINIGPAPRRYDYLATTAGAPAALELANNPVPYWLWAVEWQHPDRRPTEVWVDNRGALVSFARDFPAGAESERILLEEAQPLASKALKDFFNRETAQLTASSAGPDTWRGFPAYTFAWADPTELHGLKRRYVVRLVGREIANLDLRYELPGGYVWQYPFWQLLPLVLMMLLVMILGLYQRRQVELAVRWRVIMTALYFLLGLWMSGRMPWAGDPDSDPTVLVFLTIILALAVALMGFISFVAVERAVRRADPARFATFVRFFDRRISSEPCGLAVLRGALLGLLLVGVDAFLVSTGTTWLGMRLDSLTQVMCQAWPYLHSSWPTVHLVPDALVQTFTLGLSIAFLASLLAGFARRGWVTILGTAALGAVFLVHPFLNLGAVQPYQWKLVVLLLGYLFLAWVFIRFDTLTLMAAVFTFAFWWQNYRLLVMFEPTGARDPWLAFAIWGLLVAAAAVVAFQVPLRSTYRRLAAAFG